MSGERTAGASSRAGQDPAPAQAAEAGALRAEAGRTAPPTPRRRRVEIIDYYRLLAALAVVAFHYLYNGIRNGKVSSIDHEPIAEIAQYGHLGVELFFVISGYVIVASVTGKTARQFAVGRALRLYPAFWVALPITTAFAIFLGGERMGVEPEQVLANFTMVPTLLGQPFVDGVYWTLLYELQFYALVFLLVLFRQGHRLQILMPAWAMLMFYLFMVDPSLGGDAPYLGGYFFWFAGGAIIASVAESGWTPYRAAGLLAAFLPVTGFELTIETALEALIYLAVLATLIPAVRNLRLPGSSLAGALTYPIYLLHAHIGYMLLTTYATEQNKWVVYAGVIALVLTMAYVLHVTVERNPAARRFWSWLLNGTLGRLVDIPQLLVDSLMPTTRSPSREEAPATATAPGAAMDRDSTLTGAR